MLKDRISKYEYKTVIQDLEDQIEETKTRVTTLINE